LLDQLPDIVSKDRDAVVELRQRHVTLVAHLFLIFAELAVMTGADENVRYPRAPGKGRRAVTAAWPGIELQAQWRLSAKAASRGGA
jgi:hypothetical protein